MSKLNNALDKINEAMERELGGKKLEEGEELVFQLNDCVVVLSNEDDIVKLSFVEGKPIPVDATTGMYEEGE
jgi:hypothetical protein